MNRPEQLGNDELVAGRNGVHVEVCTDRFSEPEGRIFAETVIYVTVVSATETPGRLVVRRVVQWESTVQAVDGHRGIVRRARRSRRRKRRSVLDVIDEVFAEVYKPRAVPEDAAF